uniref:Uncharacterized protein n=1 Tax=Cacopsylla melanoneura TaxID=428564 RepID=A0A8D8RL34_9HEMI
MKTKILFSQHFQIIFPTTLLPSTVGTAILQQTVSQEYVKDNIYLEIISSVVIDRSTSRKWCMPLEGTLPHNIELFQTFMHRVISNIYTCYRCPKHSSGAGTKFPTPSSQLVDGFGKTSHNFF